MLTISEVDSFEELLKLEDEWNSLVEKNCTNTVFLTFEWISNWWKCFGHDKKLFILLAKEDDRVIGIAPLMITSIKRLGIPINGVEFIGVPLSDYSDFIISEKGSKVLQKIYEYLIEHKKRWSFIKLKRIPESSPTLKQSKEIFGCKKLFNVSFSDMCPSFIFDGGWESHKKEVNNRTMRKGINYFNKRGGISLSRFGGDVNEALRLLNIFFEQHKQRWNKTSTPSMFNDSNHKRFFESILSSLLQKGKMDLFYLKFNEKPIAFQLVFFHDNICSAYSSSYDMDYAKQSPGVMIHKFVFEYCESKKFTEYDFLRGGENYKLRFANKVKKNFRISIHKNPFLYLLDVLSDAIENRIKGNEKLRKFFIKYEKRLRIF